MSYEVLPVLINIAISIITNIAAAAIYDRIKKKETALPKQAPAKKSEPRKESLRRIWPDLAVFA